MLKVAFRELPLKNIPFISCLKVSLLVYYRVDTFAIVNKEAKYTSFSVLVSQLSSDIFALSGCQWLLLGLDAFCN